MAPWGCAGGPDRLGWRGSRRDSAPQRRSDLARTDPPNSDEATLLEAIRAGDARALDTLYGRHASFVHGLALRILQESPAAEEVTQDVFLYVWQQAERYDPSRGNLASWLVTLARSRSLDRLRARSSQARRVEGLAREAAVELPHASDPLAEVLTAERRTRIQVALATLPAEQRLALEIAYFEGLSQSAIATRLGAPLGTVKTRIRQGMRRLRQALEAPML